MHLEFVGLTERFNQTMKTSLSCFVNEHQNDWDEFLQYIAYAYITSTHATNNHTIGFNNGEQKFQMSNVQTQDIAKYNSNKDLVAQLSPYSKRL